MGATEDPDDFVLGLEYLRRQLADHGVVVSDTDFVTEIVCKLPTVYSELVTILELKLDELTVAELQQMLRTFYRRKLQHQAAGAALLAQPAQLGIKAQSRLQKPGGSEQRE
jgi:FtsZ-interacting cell division protein YlmF